MHFNTYEDMETAVANARFDATPISTDFLAAMMVAFERELETASDAAYDHGYDDGGYNHNCEDYA